MAVDDAIDKTGSSGYSAIDGSPKQRIVKLLEGSEIELTPKQISQKLNINHSSVRVYLPQLVAENRIVTPYKGAYCSRITDTVRFQGIRVHNIVVTAKADVDAHWDETVKIGTVKVRVIFGTERGKVTIFISCDAGMDRNSCLLAMDKGFGMVRGRLGKDLEQVYLKTFELNRDYLGVRVDRLTCITRVGLYDMVERIYQKEEGVRHEWKINKEMPLQEFEALLQGGVTSYNIMQANFALVKEVQKLAEAQKMTNSQLIDVYKLLEAVVKRIWGNGNP